MSIYTEVQVKMNEAKKLKNQTAVDAYNLIRGELDRVATKQDDGTKDVEDSIAIKVIGKIKKGLDETEKLGKPTSANYRGIIESYLPPEMSKESILKWIKDNISFADYKNKMQAMKPIMMALGPKGATGNTVKEVLIGM